MNGNEHIAVEDLAMFALLLLSEENAAAVREHLRDCTLCREELDQVRQDLAVYALAVEEVELPQGARERFLAKLAEEPVEQNDGAQHGSSSAALAGQAGSPGAALETGASAKPGNVVAPAKVGPVLVPRDAKTRSGLGRVLPWAGWAAAAAILVVAAGFKQDRDALRAALSTQNAQTARLEADARKAHRILGALTDPAAIRVNLTVPKAPSTPAARATYEPKSGTLLLLASNLAPLGPEKVYELWLIPASGSAPVPAGIFSPDAHGNANLLVPAIQGAVAAKAFGITIEHRGGSVTPTMPIVLAGAPT